jgi:hypothetical protein
MTDGDSPDEVTMDAAVPTAEDKDTSEDGQQKMRRLPSGGLRGLVEDWLRDHPGEEFSPNAIGKALGRSSGAVANALDKLVAAGYAAQTQDKPKRFTAVKTTPDPATPTTRSHATSRRSWWPLQQAPCTTDVRQERRSAQHLMRSPADADKSSLPAVPISPSSTFRRRCRAGTDQPAG